MIDQLFGRCEIACRPEGLEYFESLDSETLGNNSNFQASRSNKVAIYAFGRAAVETPGRPGEPEPDRM